MFAAIAAAVLFSAMQDGPPSADLTQDTRGRPVIEARINDKGPFPMVVDTAAQTSLLTLPLIEELGLPPTGETLSIDGAAGSAQADVYGVDRFMTGLFDVGGIGMLTLPNATVTEARGIVGMELMSEGRLVFDMIASRLSLEPSGPPPADYVAVKGRLDEAGLLVVPVEVDGVAFDALVDTGAGVSVAGVGALQALGWADDDGRLRSAGQIRGATQLGGAGVRSGRIQRLSLGPVNFRDLDLYFTTAGERSPQAGGATARPTLILGSDLLGHLSAYAVDFPRAELQIRIPQPPTDQTRLSPPEGPRAPPTR